MNDSTANNPVAAPERVSFWQTVGSVLAAFYGVQSLRTRERDFTRGSPTMFMLVGFGLTAAFAFVLIGAVKFMLYRAGM
jgi:hypothetical protein